MRAIFTALALSLALPITACGADSGAQTEDAATIPLTVTMAGKAHRFNVEVARTPAEQDRGLMFRTSLPVDGGMIFPFETPRFGSFWMKNTLIPLDMLFFDAEGRFVSAVRQAAPGSLVPRRSDGPAKYVLEINGGRMEADGIDAGTRLRLPVGR